MPTIGGEGNMAARRRRAEEEEELRDEPELMLDPEEEALWWQGMISLSSGAASGSGEALDIGEIALDVDQMILELRARQSKASRRMRG